MRIAWITAVRITGSPSRPISLLMAAPGVRLLKSPRWTNRPVNISAQVEALTKSELLWPMCSSQSPVPSWSLIRLSAVWPSGIRSRASARHMRTTPSSLEREYSWRSASIPPRSDPLFLTAATSRCATASILWFCSSPRVASERICSVAEVSSCRWSQESCLLNGVMAGEVVFNS